jgi:hypothetical protein
MANNEKWEGDERRSESRIRLSVDVQWDSNDGTRAGTLSDLTSNGCFILASGFFDEGATVRVSFPTSDGGTVDIVGVIANQFPDIGFALRFVDLTETQKEFLKTFAEAHETAVTE